MKPHDRPFLTADAVVFRPSARTYQVVLVQRKNEPFAGSWVLPGGFVEPGETVRDAAMRELREETGIDAAPFVDLGIADKPGRDPRGWTVSGVWGFLVPGKTAAVAKDDARAARWFDIGDLPPLAFDHGDIMTRALARMREVLRRPGGWKDLVPPGAMRNERARARVLRAFAEHRRQEKD